MPDDYWKRVGEKVQRQRESRRKYRQKKAHGWKAAALKKYDFRGKACTYCGVIVGDGGMANPRSPWNSAFCSPECWGRQMNLNQNTARES